MIDFIHMTTIYPIPENAFIPGLWRDFILKDGTPVIYHHKRATWIRYYPLTGRWTIVGKIITLLHDTHVLNIDDIYENDIEKFTNEINEYISSLISVFPPDVRDFRVSRIDYCFNIWTPHVKAYLDVMNAGFKLSNSGTRINYVQEKKLSGSVYVKTKRDYEDNARRNYVLNYYDKKNRLEYLQKRKLRICQPDWERAENILRLEVQCGFQFIKELCKACSISRSFGDLLSYKVAYDAETKIYERVFKADANQDFHSYRDAKNLLRNKTARSTLELAAEHHSIMSSKYDRGRKLIKEAGIYPFAFLPAKGEVEVLENPLKLIRRKLDDIRAVWC